LSVTPEASDKSFKLLTVYLKQKVKPALVEHFVDQFSQLLKQGNIILTGDLNTTAMKIRDGNVLYTSKNGKAATRRMLRFVAENGINVIKSFIVNDFQNMIDWVIANMEVKVSVCTVYFSPEPYH
jgi:undecaprenyl pyrophosphate synthase